MKTIKTDSKSFICAAIVLSAFVMMTACKSADSNDASGSAAPVGDINSNNSDFAEQGNTTEADVLRLRAGVGCVNNQDSPVIDPGLTANATASREVKMGYIKGSLTKSSTVVYLNQDDGKLHLQNTLLSEMSSTQGELLAAPVVTTVTCDPKLPLAKSCSTDVYDATATTTAMARKPTPQPQPTPHPQPQPKKENVCRILQPGGSSEQDTVGNFTLRNGKVISVLRQVVTTVGDITCGELKFGHGTIIQQTLLSRDVVSVAGLVACGGSVVLRSQNVILDDGHKLIQSLRSEILNAPQR